MDFLLQAELQNLALTFFHLISVYLKLGTIYNMV